MPNDIRRTRWSDINTRLAVNDYDESENDEEWLDGDAGWKKTPVFIDVPFHQRMKNPGHQNTAVADLYHRSLVSVIKEKLANPSDDEKFHYEPYDLFWKPDNESDEVRVHGELYTSTAFRDAHRHVNEAPGEPGCEAPRCVIAMMFWSDATHLTSFGNAKLWPCYLFFGNESKYRRCKPSLNLCNHVAYFQNVRLPLLPLCPLLIDLNVLQLPDSFKDFAATHVGGKGPNKAFMTHCHRELMHAQWEILLDAEFLDAYEHGILIKCCDGITRRFYPRIFTYSADYPEK